jgi:monovalent cation:H+ antiporter, CPA1 family
MAQIEAILAGFLLIALVSVMVSRKVKTPFTILLVLVGLALSAFPIVQLAGLTGFFNSLANEQIFVGLILPPLLFESIMSVKVSDFRAVYRPALLLATAGVIVSTLVVGVVLWKVVGLSPLVSFLFAALISPTDVATVLEVFSRVNVPTKLATLVGMESVFNDPTGIAVFTVVLTASTASALQPIKAVADFTFILSTGILVGTAVAWGARWVQKQIEDSVTQVVLTLVAVYGSYAVASAVGGSGLIAVAITGLFYGNTVLSRVESKRIADATKDFWGIVAFMANAAAFFLIGVSTNIFLLATSAGAFLVAYGVVMMARITAVYPIMSLSRMTGSVIPSSWMNTTALGGMRGALAIILVSAIPLSNRQPVATLTFGVVILSILLQGPLLSRYTRTVFGRQETLKGYKAYDTDSGSSPAQADPEPSPEQPLSSEGGGRGDDELR